MTPCPSRTRSNLVDCLITGGQVLDAQRGTAYRRRHRDQLSHGNRLAVKSKRPTARSSKSAILAQLAGKQTINATNCLVLPGRVAFLKTGIFENQSRKQNDWTHCWPPA